MPALITHYLQSCEVCKRLEKENIAIEPLAVDCGAQGPDVLYFHRLIPLLQNGRTYRKIGLRLHAYDPDQMLSSLQGYIIDHPDDVAAKSYALGFICHYSLDRIAHPYVYAVQKAIIEAEKVRYNNSFVHSRIEHNLDVIMLREKRGLNGTELNPAHCITADKKILEPASAILADMINIMEGEGTVTPRKVAQAFLDTRRNQKHLHDPFMIKRPIFRMLEKITFVGPAVSSFIRPIIEDDRWDYSNFEKNIWVSPYQPEVERADSFFELFDASVEDSLQMIHAFLKNIEEGNRSFEITGKLSFKSGLPQEQEANL